MANDANDKSQRTAADKERSRQMSRSVSGKDAARTAIGGRTSQQGGPSRGPGKGGGAQVQSKSQSKNGRDVAPRSPAKGSRGPAPGAGSAGSGRSGGGGNRPGQRPQRRPAAPAGRSRTGLFIWGSIALVIVIVGVLIGVNLSSSTPTVVIYDAKPVPAKVLSEITHVPSSVYNAVGAGIAGDIAAPKVEKGQPPLIYTGKPGVLGVVGEFCPYCAAERWSIITSFSRFGRFAGLKTMQSSPVDVYPKTQTFTFRNATYSSPYFTPRLIEYFGQDYNKTGAHRVIGTLTKSEQRVVAKYDRSTTTSSSSGGTSIPFMDIGNKLIIEGAAYSPGPLQNLSRTQIAAGLSTTSNPVTKLIIGSSNYLSASICSLTGGKPGAVCHSSGVQAAAKVMNVSF